MNVVTAGSRRWHLTAHPTAAAARSGQWRWLAGGLALAFAIPFVLTDLASIDRDLYYLAYFAGVFGFVGAWLRYGVAAPRDLLTHHWRSGIVVGLAFVAVMGWIVQREPATAHPRRPRVRRRDRLAGRGLRIRGRRDPLRVPDPRRLLRLRGDACARATARQARRRRPRARSLAPFTAVYHLGYSDFRGEKLRKPLAGDAIWSVPTLATLSPLASPITHAGLHVNAVVHSYDTDTFLPPHRSSAGAARPELQAILDSLVVGRGAHRARRDRIRPRRTGRVARRGRRGRRPEPASRCRRTPACGSRACRRSGPAS